MEIRSESRIRYPRDVVYRTYRDRLPEIAKYIPDIREVQVLGRTEAAHGVDLHNLWIADREIPAVAAAFVKPDQLRWDDLAAWHDASYYAAWTLRTRVFTEAVRCAGRNTFLEDGARATRVVLTGEFTIDLDAVPGVPGFLKGRMGPQIEKFIVSLITPNLERVNASIEKFLDEHS